ncbi:AAA family ATPase [Pseudonocardia sp. NPDC049635]|uniref:AAA family ATPase n=1 Tax=Pseudonocardia sp. NPDC049635 TaxID=3155506 RepID=UPI0033CAC44F
MTLLDEGLVRAGASPPAMRSEPAGRSAEIAVLDRLLTRTRAGAGGAIVLWGEPGIGKSVLLAHVHDRAQGFLRLHHRAARPESDLLLAGIHGLLRPFTDRPVAPAATGYAAAEVAPDRRDESADRLRTGTAALSLFCRLAEDRPVLVVLDDAQWLDRASADCLGFVARRVQDHPVLVVLADQSDPSGRPWEGVTALQVRELAEGPARQLVTIVDPSAGAREVDETVRAAGGNPLALHETAATSPGGRQHVPAGRPSAGPRMRRAFRAGLDALGAPARLLTVLAAAEDDGDLLTVRRAAGASGADGAAWDEAVRAGLLHVDGCRVGFRHPVVRHAVYDSCDAELRRHAHRALAAAVPEDSEARAWHLAAAADDRDEAIATLLEHAAGRARLRGATTTAARALQRAAELSPSRAEASRRIGEAAFTAWDAGRVGTAAHLLEEAERLSPSPQAGPHGRGLRGILELARGMPERAHQHLTADLDRAPDRDTALELGLLAARAGWSAGRRDLQDAALERLHGPDLGADPALLATWRDDPASPAPVPSRDDLAARIRAAPPGLLPPPPLVLVWDVAEPAREVLQSRAPRLRRCSARSRLADVLVRSALLDALAGRVQEAESSAVEALALAEDLDADHIASEARNCLGRLAAVGGERHRVAETVERVLATSLPQGFRALTAVAYWNRGTAALLQDHPEEALDDLGRLAEPGHAASHPTIALLACLDTAEAAVQLERFEIAQERARVLDAWARHTGAPWARCTAHVVRGMLGGPDGEAAFRAALDVPGAAAQPLVHARARLLYGEWLRRGRRRTEARTLLAAAAEAFGRLGAEPLRRRALHEHDLTGLPGRSAGGTGRGLLTEQERRVARLAAEQMTNREIAARLRISHRTVGHHLGNVFAKLGISTRTELRSNGERSPARGAGDRRFSPDR